MKLRSNVKSEMTARIARLTEGYIDHIPLHEIFMALSAYSCIAVAEDGTPWEGFLCGETGRANIDLQYNGMPVDNAMLALSWYKMQSGRYEVVAYIS